MINKKIISAALCLSVALSFSGCQGDPFTQNANVPDNGTVQPDHTTALPEDKESVSGDIVEGNAGGSEEPGQEAEKNEYADKHIRLTLNDSGWDVFAPSSAHLPDYRYGPSIMLNDDGSIDAWFSAPGDGAREFDWITHRHSDDGGETWTDERSVISPSPCSPDYLSTCDPDVFYYDGYYYMGYTSTINRKAKGICNSVFLARSESPDGPYEKWNGHGWGGAPVPMIYFDGMEIGWGCGEPSFVVVDDTIYVYTTKDSYSGVPDRVRVTEVRTANITEEDWPAKLEFKGYAIVRNDGSAGGDYQYRDSDSSDFAYIEESKKFVAVSTNRRFKNDSCLLYYESNDGIHFDRVSELNTNVISRCHNCGIMADGQAHIKEGDPVILGYAYAGSKGSGWGIWSTRFVTATLDYTDEPDRSDEGKSNLKQALRYRSGTGDAAPMMLCTDQLVYGKRSGTGAFKIGYYVQDNYKNRRAVPASEIDVIDYDPDILSVDEGSNISPKLPGITWVTVGYQGLTRQICLCVYGQEGYDSKGIKDFYPVVSRYELTLVQPYVIKVRPMAVFGDYRIHELTGMELMRHGVTFASDDTSICDVKEDGTFIPVSAGDTVIRVTTKEGLGYSIDVHILP